MFPWKGPGSEIQVAYWIEVEDMSFHSYPCVELVFHPYSTTK